MSVDHEHLREWVDTGRATVVAADRATRFVDHLQSLPWLSTGTYPAWDRIPHLVVRCDGLTDDQIAASSAGTRIAAHGHLLALYSPRQPALLVRYQDGIRNIDALYWRSPGPRYMCGADLDGAELTLACADLVEFDGSNQLRFTV